MNWGTSKLAPFCCAPSGLLVKPTATEEMGCKDPCILPKLGGLSLRPTARVCSPGPGGPQPEPNPQTWAHPKARRCPPRVPTRPRPSQPPRTAAPACPRRPGPGTQTGPRCLQPWHISMVHAGREGASPFVRLARPLCSAPPTAPAPLYGASRQPAGSGAGRK